MINLSIENEGYTYNPPVLDGIKWSTERQGVPGKLTFEVVKNGDLNFQEGNPVKLYVDEKPVFFGFVFQKKRDKGETISVTAYDQLRYLKNKDTYVYENKKASEFIEMIAKDVGLTCGEIADTEYVIENDIQDNKTFFDMIQDTLDTTLKNTKKIFVLYDNFGKLTLKNIEDMKVNYIVMPATAENFDYSTSIDGETYNQIKLSYDNKETGKRDIYIAMHSENINKWGLLQMYEKVQSGTGIPDRALAMLSLYNRKSRSLSIKNALGDLDVRAGSSVGVALNLGDIEVNSFFICEKVTHTFKGDMHLMDLSLRGSDFIV